MKNEIIRATLLASGLTAEVLFSRSRKKEVIIWRQICTELIYSRYTTHLETIAKIVGFDHATVLHSKNHVRNMLDTKDWQYMEAYKSVVKYLSGDYNLSFNKDDLFDFKAFAERNPLLNDESLFRLFLDEKFDL